MKDKLTEQQVDELLGEVRKAKTLNKVQEEREEIKEIEKEIRDLEAEIDWAESQASDDYKYITHLEHRLDKLYEKYNQMDNYESF
tara:strand:- start:331 stop:585 length:255 start_codon:yes stop_codon:yes gene_type:complete